VIAPVLPAPVRHESFLAHACLGIHYHLFHIILELYRLRILLPVSTHEPTPMGKLITTY